MSTRIYFRTLNFDLFPKTIIHRYKHETADKVVCRVTKCILSNEYVEHFYQIKYIFRPVSSQGVHPSTMPNIPRASILQANANATYQRPVRVYTISFHSLSAAVTFFCFVWLDFSIIKHKKEFCLLKE